MKPLCCHLVLRWWRHEAKVRGVLVLRICLAPFLHCEVFVSWSHFGRGYFARIQTITCFYTWYQKGNEMEGGHEFVPTPPIETGDSGSSPKSCWPLRSLRLWQKGLRTLAWRDRPLPSSWMLLLVEVSCPGGDPATLRVAGWEEAGRWEGQRCPASPSLASSQMPADNQNWAPKLRAQSPFQPCPAACRTPVRLVLPAGPCCPDPRARESGA